METDSDLTDLDQLEESSKTTASSTPKKPKPKANEYRIKDTLKPPHLSQYSAKTLYEWIHEGVVELEPDYQREVVWLDSKQTKLIDSLLRNFYVPPIIFRVVQDEHGMERRICIDGKQRLTSLQRFMDGAIPHQDPDSKKRYWFKDSRETSKTKKELLPKIYRDHLERKQLACIEYRDLEDRHERDIFQRVQMGMPLQPAERMSALAGSWPDFVTELKKKYMVEGELPKHLTLDTSRSKDFLLIAQVLVGVTALPDRHSFSSALVEKWLNRADPPTKSFRQEIHHVFSTLTELISAPAHSKVFDTRMAPVEFVLISLIIADHPGEEIHVLAKYVDKLRVGLRKKHVDIRTNTKVVNTGYELLAEMGGGTGKGKNVSSAMKRKHEDNEYRGGPVMKPVKAVKTRSQATVTIPARTNATVSSSAGASGTLREALGTLHKIQDRRHQLPEPPRAPASPTVFGGIGSQPPTPITYMGVDATPTSASSARPMGQVEQWFASNGTSTSNSFRNPPGQ